MSEPQVTVTFFPSQSARSMRVISGTLEELRKTIQSTTAASKAKLPWLKLATFGNRRSERNCLRFNDNVEAITGVELDYDGKEMTLDAAVAIAQNAELQALVYTSASYTDAAPKWRILLPTSKPLPPYERNKLVARVNGLYVGIFDDASFTLSQAYYFGSINNNPVHRAVTTQGDYLDLRDDLNAGAMDKNGNEPQHPKANGSDDTNYFEDYGNERFAQAPREKVEAAIEAIPNDDNVDRERWVTIGHALKSELPDEDYLELFKQWSSTWTGGDYDEAYTIEKWNSFRPKNITIGTVFYLADQVSPGWWEQAQEQIRADDAELGVFDAGDDIELPPPRGWLLGNTFARGFMSSLLADGGTGKTALRYAQFIAMATAREITGEHVFLRSRVLVVSLEDDRNELRRRIAAVRNHYDIAPDELKGWLFYCTPKADNGKLMVTDKYGRPTRGQLANTIETIINKHNIDLVCLDPFVKSHSVGENDNNAIDDVAQVLTDIAAKYDIAVDAPHHTSKGIPDPGNANRGRGASSMKDAGRLIYTLTPMSEQEAERFNVPEEQRRRLIRVDSAKVNLLPPSASARWFKLVSVQLDNATDLYPNGDHIQTVEPWDPPHTWEGMDPSLQKRILIQIDAGLADGNRYTDGPNAKGREAWRVVLAQVPTKTQQQAKEMVKTWVEAGVLKVREYQNPTTRKLVNGLFLDAKKLSS